jgi:hypothetical protein
MLQQLLQRSSSSWILSVRYKQRSSSTGIICRSLVSHFSSGRLTMEGRKSTLLL